MYMYSFENDARPDEVGPFVDRFTTAVSFQPFLHLLFSYKFVLVEVDGKAQTDHAWSISVVDRRGRSCQVDRCGRSLWSSDSGTSTED